MPPPHRPTLSVIVPTRRGDLAARQTLTTVAMAGCADIEVLIGDNSADPDKHRFLHALQASCVNVKVFCHPQDIGAHANYSFLLHRTTAEAVCLTADDDIVATNYYAAAAEILANHPDTAVASGLLIGITPGHNSAPAQLFRAASRTEDTAFERIREYGGVNLLAYATARRAPLRRMGEYLADTPLRASFIDYLGSYFLLAEGKFRIDESRPVYLYTNDKWGDEATAWKTSAAFYVANGLPESFQHFHSVAWSVACLHLFLSRYRPAALGPAEAQPIAELLYDRWRADFIEKYRRNPALFQDLLGHSAAARHALLEFVAGQPATPARRFSAFLAILAAFSADLAARYAAFLQASLPDPEHRPGSRQDQPPEAERDPPAPPDTSAADERECLRTRIRALESSTSWRITAPLRTVATWIRAPRR